MTRYYVLDVVIWQHGDVRKLSGIASGLRHLGQVFRMQEDIPRARECWDKALEIFEAIEDPRADEVRALLGDILE